MSVLYQGGNDNFCICDSASNSHMTKDDITRLMHLFKEQLAQRNWSYLHGVRKGAELGAHINPIASIFMQQIHWTA
jgi:hypothetical protein